MVARIQAKRNGQEREMLTAEPLLLTVEEAARKCGIGKTKMYEELTRGRCESVLIGRARRIPADAVDAYVELLRKEARQGFNLPTLSK